MKTAPNAITADDFARMNCTGHDNHRARDQEIRAAVQKRELHAAGEEKQTCGQQREAQ
jgi:hypothetical protein